MRVGGVWRDKKPSTAITLEDKVTVVNSISLHHVILKTKAEIDQFADGLSCLGTKKIIMKYPDLIERFFTIHGRQVLTVL